MSLVWGRTKARNKIDLEVEFQGNKWRILMLFFFLQKKSVFTVKLTDSEIENGFKNVN